MKKEAGTWHRAYVTKQSIQTQAQQNPIGTQVMCWTGTAERFGFHEAWEKETVAETIIKCQ